ncbi:uncharacterized protein [Gossypium hirsutum]|uniref:Uncharacterized protein n=1 Tax=Gossypium hirsutum TaxID=3635 RepID=A0ABM2ZYY8_GOSHI|nr:uncharacterized protein LOC121216313 [Gossypium hirsutum]
MSTSLPVQAMYSMCASPSPLGGYASSWATTGPYNTTTLMHTGLIGSTMTHSPNIHWNTRLLPQTGQNPFVSSWPIGAPILRPSATTIFRTSNASTGSVSQTPQAHIATQALLDDNAWYSNSGATHHLTNFETSLTSSVPYLGSDK